MEKLGHIFLFCINLLINVFFICLIILVFAWLIEGISPQESVQSSLSWIERTFRFPTNEPIQRPNLGNKQLKKAQENMYIQKNIITE